MRRLWFGYNSNATLELFDTLEDCARRTVSGLQIGSVALSGGKTFAALFAHWADLKPDCSKAVFYPVDERVVPIESPDSNWGTACSRLLTPLGRDADRANFAPDVETYDRILRDRFGEGVPVFDTIFLGVGDDGHTASLFPGASHLDDASSVVLGTQSPKVPVQRVTLGPVVLSRARNVGVNRPERMRLWAAAREDIGGAR